MILKEYKFFILCLLVLGLVLVIPNVYADMGPKPTTKVEIIGIDEDYYFDLMAEYDEEDVVVLNETEVIEQIEYDYYRDDYPQILNGYYDEGFAAYTLYTNAPHSITKITSALDTYACGYYSPPDTFKVVIVTESKDIIISSVVNKQMFDANVIFDLSKFNRSTADYENYNGYRIFNVGSDFIKEHIPVARSITQVLVTVISTLVIEVIIALAFNYRLLDTMKKIIIVNLITQTLLYSTIVISYLYADFFGYFGALLLGELIVFITEIILYRSLLKEHGKVRAMSYAFIANAASLIMGILFLPMFL